VALARVPLGSLLQPGLARLRRACLDPLDDLRPVLMRQSWQILCDAGVAGVLAPRSCGGQGSGLMEAVELARGLSRLACGVPFLASAVLATRLADAAQATGLLAELATGDAVATVAFGGTVRAESGRMLLCGLLEDVLHGADVDTWLVVAQTPEGTSVLVQLPRPSFEVVPTADASRPVVQARLADLPVTVLQPDCGASVRAALAQAEIVRCAEVAAAAEMLLAGRPDAVALLRAARAAVDLAATVADVDGALDPALVAVASAWTSLAGADARRRFSTLRARQDSRWTPAV
jgi:hypothetical protein